MKLIMKLKKWIRKEYLFWKYKHNWNTHRLIVLNENDRRYGLTFMMIKDCLEKKCVLFVRDYHEKHMFAQIMCEYSQLGLIPFITEREAFDKYLMCPSDISCHKHLGRRDLKFIVDNSCGYNDVMILYRECLNIVNGFVCIYVAA